MTCHVNSAVVPVSSETKRVALIGMPNTGKSTLFNRLTGATAAIANWPGVTVDLKQAQVNINDESIEFVDLPGIYDLSGFSEDEKIVQHFLANFPLNLAIVILNASQIDRQIRLPLQIQALGLPTVVILNMADEAERYGVKIATDQLSQSLNTPVLLLSAKHGRGYTNAYKTIADTLQAHPQPYQVNNLKTHLDQQEQVSNETIASLLQETVVMPSQLAVNFTTKLDQLLLHPLLGLPLFFLGMFLIFTIIWQIGLPTQDIVASLTDWLQGNLLEPLITSFPQLLQDFVINGVWNGIATVASFVPLIVLFFVLMAVLEDSGYLARSAYLMDALMSKLGLDGRSFVLQMMGFGCNVPALMGTRVMRSQALRFLTMLIIPFALCSARLQVFVFIIAAVFPNGNGAIVLFSLYCLSFLAAVVTAALFQGVFQNEEPFILELPPYRLPTWRQVWLRGWGEVKEFLTRASSFIAFGCIAVWTITSLPPNATGLETIGGQIGTWLSPVMSPLGIDPYLTLALIFGFVAKEVVVGSLAVIYGLNAANVTAHLTETITFLQGYSFCLFCLLYTPCLSTVVTIFNESKSGKFTLLSLVFSLVLAWVASFIFYQGALLLGWG